MAQYRRRKRRLKVFNLVVLLSLVIVVVGGGFLGIRALLNRVGGDPTVGEPNTPPTSGVGETAPPKLTEADEIRGLTFTDVAADAPYHDAVCYAVSRGYFPDVVGGAFDPDRFVTNKELALVMGAVSGEEYALVDQDAGKLTTRQILTGFLVASATKLELDMSRTATLGGYPDVDALEPEIKPGMAWALEAGLFEELIGLRLHPELAVSRAQLAQVLLKFDRLRPACELARELAREGGELVKVSLSAETLADLQSAIETSIKKHGAPGAQVAIIQNGEIVAELVAGWATKNSDAMTVDHKMRVASISKVAVGMEIMALAEEGAVNLDEPIGTYWGAAFQNPYYAEPVTMRNIMTHTSSIIAAGDNTSRAHDDVLALLSSNRGYTNTKPGDFSGWAYNNYAYSVLGQTVELAAGKTMDAMLYEQFGDALDIDVSYAPGGIEGLDKLTTLYKEDGTPWRTPAQLRGNTPYTTPGENGKYFAGGFTSSAGDLAKLIAILAGDGRYQGLKFLEPETVAAMETVLPEPHPEENYYQGLPMDYQKGLYGREGIFYHNGNAYGAFTCASYDPVTGDGVVVLTNGAYPAKRNGIYIVCNEINEAVYNAMK